MDLLCELCESTLVILLRSWGFSGLSRAALRAQSDPQGVKKEGHYAAPDFTIHLECQKEVPGHEMCSNGSFRAPEILYIFPRIVFVLPLLLLLILLLLPPTAIQFSVAPKDYYSNRRGYADVPPRCSFSSSPSSTSSSSSSSPSPSPSPLPCYLMGCGYHLTAL